MSCSEWKEGYLKDIANITMGQSPKGATCNTVANGTPLLNGPTEFGQHHPYPVQFTIEPKKICEPGDLLFCVRGSTVGRMNWADTNYAIGRGLAFITPKIPGTNHFIKGVLEFKLGELLSISNGSTFPNITRSMLTDIKINIPSINEIMKISKILETIDNKIELNNEMNKTLEKMSESLFKRWFIDFEFPNEYGQPYKSSGGEMVESELGMIPKGWEVKTIEDVSTTVSKGTTPTKKDIDSAEDENTINFIKVKDIDDYGEICLNNLEKIPESVHNGKLKRSILYEKDILFSIAGTIGRVTSIDKTLNNSNMNQAIAFIRLKDCRNMFNFIFYLLKSEKTQNDIKSNIVQAVQANVSLGVLKAIKFVQPSKEILDKYNNIAMNIYDKQQNIRYENNDLKVMRDTLLPKLMSGEIILDKKL